MTIGEKDLPSSHHPVWCVEGGGEGGVEGVGYWWETHLHSLPLLRCPSHSPPPLHFTHSPSSSPLSSFWIESGVRLREEEEEREVEEEGGDENEKKQNY